MKASGLAEEIGLAALKAHKAIADEIIADEKKIKELHAMRLADEKHKHAWNEAEIGLARAKEIMRRLHELARQCSGVPPRSQVELAPEEVALFAYVQIK